MWGIPEKSIKNLCKVIFWSCGQVYTSKNILRKNSNVFSNNRPSGTSLGSHYSVRWEVCNLESVRDVDVDGGEGVAKRDHLILNVSTQLGWSDCQGCWDWSDCQNYQKITELFLLIRLLGCEFLETLLDFWSTQGWWWANHMKITFLYKKVNNINLLGCSGWYAGCGNAHASEEIQHKITSLSLFQIHL